MDNFSVIYKILKTLEKALDFEEFDKTPIQNDGLGITHNRWCAIIEMLIDNGYVKGAVCVEQFSGKSININNIQITLKGLEYLNENSFMKKVCDAAKGIIDVIK